MTNPLIFDPLRELFHRHLNCLMRQRSHGHTLYDHAAITLVVVCPRQSQGIALPPAQCPRTF